MNEWFYPEELKKSEEDYRLNKVKTDTNNDFGSYKKMLEDNDIEKSNISNHNDIMPSKKIKSIKRICEKFFTKSPNQILNIGCGLGFETNCIIRDL